MPLLDHFHPPLSVRRHWEGFLPSWVCSIAAQLNQGLLPTDHFAEVKVSRRRIEADISTWAPAAHALEMDAVFPPTFAVLVFGTSGGITLVGAIELVSPSNKARPSERRAFAVKCLSYLHEGIGLIIADVVTDRLANLHDEMAGVLGGSAPTFPGSPPIYASAYRPFRRGEESKVGVWPVPLAVSEPLPVLPLYLRGVDDPVPVDLEAAYTEARRGCAIG